MDLFFLNISCSNYKTLMHNCYSINIVNIILTNTWVRDKYMHDLWNKEKGIRVQIDLWMASQSASITGIPPMCFIEITRYAQLVLNILTIPYGPSQSIC